MRITGNGKRDPEVERASCRRWTTCWTCGTARSPTAGTRSEPGVGAFHHGRDGQPPTPIKIRAHALGRVLRDPAEHPEARRSTSTTRPTRCCRAAGWASRAALPSTGRCRSTTTPPTGSASRSTLRRERQRSGEPTPASTASRPTDQGGPFLRGLGRGRGPLVESRPPAAPGPDLGRRGHHGHPGARGAARAPGLGRSGASRPPTGGAMMHDLWREQVERVQRGTTPSASSATLPTTS